MCKRVWSGSVVIPRFADAEHVVRPLQSRFYGEIASRRFVGPKEERLMWDRLEEKVSPATINRETTHLARAFWIAVKSGLLSVMPSFPDRLEESAPRQGFFEHAEYFAVREELTPAVYQDVLDFAYYSGWRRGGNNRAGRNDTD